MLTALLLSSCTLFEDTGTLVLENNTGLPVVHLDILGTEDLFMDKTIAPFSKGSIDLDVGIYDIIVFASDGFMNTSWDLRNVEIYAGQSTTVRLNW